MIVSIMFGTKSSEVLYSRAVYNVLDLVGDIGGLFDGLKAIGSVLMAPIASHNMRSFLINKLYFTQKIKRKP